VTPTRTRWPPGARPAWMLAERGKFEEAEDLYRKVLAVRERVLGDAHPDTLATRLLTA